MNNTFFAAIFLMVCFSNCIKNKKNYTYNELKNKGDSVATSAQQILVKNLTEQIHAKGFEFAVSFCNENANELLKNLEIATNTSIKRLALKTRNKNNTCNETEANILNTLAEQYAQTGIITDTVVIETDNKIYYKTISIGMETCLKCHGDKKNIDPIAYHKIRALYPNDEAIGFKLKEFRGAWKIKL
jgi:hypothetical protein